MNRLALFVMVRMRIPVGIVMLLARWASAQSASTSPPLIEAGAGAPTESCEQRRGRIQAAADATADATDKARLLTTRPSCEARRELGACSPHVYGEASAFTVFAHAGTGLMTRAALGLRMHDCADQHLELRVGGTFYVASDDLHSDIGSDGGGGELEVNGPVGDDLRLGARIGVEHGGHDSYLVTGGVRLRWNHTLSVGADVYAQSSYSDRSTRVMLGVGIDGTPGLMTVGLEALAAVVTVAYLFTQIRN